MAASNRMAFRLKRWVRLHLGVEIDLPTLPTAHACALESAEQLRVDKVGVSESI